MSMFFGGGGGGACRIIVNGAGDWEITPPAGQITQIGDAGVTANGLVANDDFFVTGCMEVRDLLFVGGVTTLFDDLAFEDTANMAMNGASGESTFFAKLTDEVTIAIGQGLAGVMTGIVMCPIDSVILGVVARVTQAPGGGATEWNACVDIGNPDQLMESIAVALGTTATNAADGDGSEAGPFFCAADAAISITTDANVIVSDMKIRLTVFYMKMYPPTS